MKVTVKLDSAQAILKKRGLERGGKAQQAAASKALELCSAYVPLKTGRLEKSGHVTKDGLVWDAPYAKQAYYGKNGGGSFSSGMRGPYWAARMKADRMDEITQAAAKAAGGKKA